MPKLWITIYALVLAGLFVPASSPGSASAVAGHKRMHHISVRPHLKPKPWVSDLMATRDNRACVAYHETHGSSHPYTQRSLLGLDYWGKYQYDPSTWHKAVIKARRFYHSYITRKTQQAATAPPWVQEAVTAFALNHPDLLGWKPWPYCYST